MRGDSFPEGHPQACRVTEGSLPAGGSLCCGVLQTYIRSMDKDFVAATIQAIGRCATNIGRVRDTCLNGLVQLLSNRDGQCLSECPAWMTIGCLPTCWTASGYPPVCLGTMCVHLSVCLHQCPGVPASLRATGGVQGGEEESQGLGALQCLSTCMWPSASGVHTLFSVPQSWWSQSRWSSLRSCCRCSQHSTERSSSTWQSSQITSRWE